MGNKKNMMCELGDEELRDVVPKVVTVLADTWQDIGYYTDERGIKRYGLIPRVEAPKAEIKLEKNVPKHYRTSDPRLVY